MTLAILVNEYIIFVEQYKIGFKMLSKAYHRLFKQMNLQKQPYILNVIFFNIQIIRWVRFLYYHGWEFNARPMISSGLHSVRALPLALKWLIRAIPWLVCYPDSSVSLFIPNTPIFGVLLNRQKLFIQFRILIKVIIPVYEFLVSL